MIPAYQAERYIEGAIRSALAQDRPAHEVIVVDDGSTDSTADIVRSFGHDVRLVSQPNGGEAAARNTGLRSATTEWVAFLDADDEYLPHRLTQVADYIRTDPTIDLVTTDALFVFPTGIDGQCYGPHWRFAHDGQRQEILRRNFIFSHTVVRRERLLALGGFDESIRYATDWAMWLVLILDGGRAALVDEPLSLYRVHTGSLSANRLAMARGGVHVIEKALGLELSPDEERVALESLRTQRALVDRELLSNQLAVGSSGVRPLAWRVVRNDAQERAARARALVSLALPRVGSAIVKRRRRRLAVGTMGRTFAKESVDTSGGPRRRADELQDEVVD